MILPPEGLVRAVEFILKVLIERDSGLESVERGRRTRTRTRTRPRQIHKRELYG
jgi:hypothetical protein